jgi:hypothetical protein
MVGRKISIRSQYPTNLILRDAALQRFEDLMKKNAGRLKFAGSDNFAGPDE